MAEHDVTAGEQMKPDSPVLPSKSTFELREELEDLVIKELHGPAGGPNEEVEDRVRERYLVGLLAPRQQTVHAEEMDTAEVSDPDSSEDGGADTAAPTSDTLFPSSFGFTFTVEDSVRSLQATASWGRYHREHSETLVDTKGNPKLVWKREPMAGTVMIPLQDGTLGPFPVTPEAPEVVIRGQARQVENFWIVSLFLVNNQEEPNRREDAAWLFQPELKVEAKGGAPVFLRRANRSETAHLDVETRFERVTMGMLYRNSLEFAVGHGVAVHVDTATGNPERAVRVSTSVVPAYEVPKQTPPTLKDKPALAGLILDMKELSEMTDADLVSNLRILPQAYAEWIDEERAKIGDPKYRLDDYADAAREAVSNCVLACERIKAGVELLGTTPVAAQAFRFANEAMWKQRVHTEFALKRRRGADVELSAIDVPANRRWYPFQLAFILLNLPSVTDLHHPDRSDPTGAIADLLWFPTGGGKTEAYLGLTAYTIGLRRLQGIVGDRSGGDGIAVLMRYTLRLLTLQQFQRAATLMCACELIRRSDEDTWGKTRFRLGLWVGQRTTPNTTEKSDEAVKSDRGTRPFGGQGGSGTPEQLTSCPWCGHRIDAGEGDIKVDKVAIRTVIFCGDKMGRCEFSRKRSPGEGVPAVLVDEEIYRLLPCLLIATVDKYAQMPWNGQTQMLFGQVSKWCSRHGFRSPETDDTDSHNANNGYPKARSEERDPLRPPDLIIQDELHLISGPLGTLVGLYETAVDELCAWTVEGRKVRPKVIASTATIRRAESQINSLFLRKTKVFPPHATDIRDNFFSMQREPSEEFPGRRYLGICATGRRFPVAMIRVYVAFLAAARKLYNEYGEKADPWMTLVGYFNSMRELGGTRRLVEDDISTRLRDMDKRGLAKRRRVVLEELTSRKGSADIPLILDRLELVFDPAGEARRKEQRDKKGKVDPEPLDALLATNMISVGVDVNRLGLMVVAGQPKTTAEYIQATSRVGRRWPGLVCTVFNWARPRDMSHYETFEHYHTTFYQHVEALSVTPFAPRALDRGLTGVFVSLVRLATQELNANQSAGQFRPTLDLVKRAVEAIAERAALVTGKTEDRQLVQQMLQVRIDDWNREAQKRIPGRRLGYKVKKDGVTVNLLTKPGPSGWERFTCLNSLRDVEPSVNLILRDARGMDIPSDDAPTADTAGAPVPDASEGEAL